MRVKPGSKSEEQAEDVDVDFCTVSLVEAHKVSTCSLIDIMWQIITLVSSRSWGDGAISPPILSTSLIALMF